jgi:predicted permease
MRFRYVLRRLLQAPGFTLITAVTLAAGIGANSAIFSVIEGVLLKPLPYPHADQLISLGHSSLGINLPNVGTAPFLYFTYREEGRAFEQQGAWNNASVSITGMSEPEQVKAIQVTSEVLPALKVQPALGRWFSQADASPVSPETAILMNSYWRARFGGDPKVLGRRIMIDGKATEVIGVMPESFRFLTENPSLILPLRFDRNKVYLGNFSYDGIARLKPGVTIEQAGADITRMIPIAMDKFPPFPGYSKRMFDDARLSPRLQPLKDSVVGDIGKTLWVLMGTIGVVLLIACANVANLLLVRADGRQQEMAIRAALGASWFNIAGELLMESLALGLLGGAFGLAIAYGALNLLIALAPAHLPRLEDISVDANVLLFTLGVSLLAGFIFGLLPVFKYAAPRVAMALRAGGRTISAGRERLNARGVLVIAQFALALVLLIGSGLMIRTFQALRHVDPGFVRPAEVQTLVISIPQTQVADSGATIHMEQNILDKISAIPGVTSAGITTVVPLDGGGWHDAIWDEDHPAQQNHIPPMRRYKFVSPGLIATMGNRLVAGHDITWQDTYNRRPVAMLSENLARELWGDPQRAIGKRIRQTQNGPWREVIAVVTDEREDGLEKDAPTTVYWPLWLDRFDGDKEQVTRSVYYVVRSPRTGSRSLIDDIQHAVWSIDSNLPLAHVQTLQAIYEKSMARTSFTLVMLAIASGMAMLIGLVGIYGVISYSVTQRRREIGIRLALGAPREQVTGMFVKQAVALAGVGTVCGLTAALALTRLMKSLLFGVAPVDPLTYAILAAVLVLAAIGASYIPALRATHVDPVEALRAE